MVNLFKADIVSHGDPDALHITERISDKDLVVISKDVPVVIVISHLGADVHSPIFAHAISSKKGVSHIRPYENTFGLGIISKHKT